jgi:DNA primase
MGQFSDSVLQEIRSRVDVVDLIGQYVPLRRAGANHKGICPFHREKSPSFLVHPEKQIYRCFGCGASGNVFGFLMQYEGMSFPDAVRHLAERAGVTLDRTGPAGPPRQLTERLKQIHKAAAALYARKLLEPGGEAARQYLQRRSLELDFARELGLGFAPESWDFVKNALLGQGFELAELESSGLIKRADGESNRTYDRFRNRLIFPVTDPYGTVIAFGGRTLGDDQAKYINSPESPIYHKGNQLFGLHVARDAIKEAGHAVLVEGNFDCVLPWSRGVRPIVASLGTALTAAHARLLKRYTELAVLLFDQDAAGQASQRKAAELLLEEGFEVRIATLDRHKDPADYVVAEGAEALRACIAAAEEAVLFFARQAAAQMQDSPRSRAKAVASVLPLIERIVDPIERAESLALVADRLQVDRGLVQQQLGRSTAPRGRGAHEPAQPPPAAPQALWADEAELALARALALHPELLVQFLEQFGADELKSPGAREIVATLSSLYSDEHPPQLADVIARLASEPLRRQVSAWAFEAETGNLAAEFHEHLQLLRARRLEQEHIDLLRRQKEAELAGDLDLVRELQKRYVAVRKEWLSEHAQRQYRPPEERVPPQRRLKSTH